MKWYNTARLPDPFRDKVLMNIHMIVWSCDHPWLFNRAVSAVLANPFSNADMFPCVPRVESTQDVTAHQALVCSPRPTDLTTGLCKSLWHRLRIFRINHIRLWIGALEFKIPQFCLDNTSKRASLPRNRPEAKPGKCRWRVVLAVFQAWGTGQSEVFWSQPGLSVGLGFLLSVC